MKVKKKLFSEIPYLKGERVVLKKITEEDAPYFSELATSLAVSRFIPAFLYEKQNDDILYVIRHLYDECMEESLFLGIYVDGEFAGIMELYGYRDETHKVSIGCRLREKFWKLGISTEATGLLIFYLFEETDIEILTASTMVENQASRHVLEKLGFDLVIHAAEEDWGLDRPATVDKWIRSENLSDLKKQLFFRSEREFLTKNQEP